MDKIELMHSIYGKCERCVCWDCHFCHWKIAGSGDNKRIDTVWCEIYGINRENITETEWKFKYPACGIYNLDHYPPRRQIWKLAKKGDCGGMQMSLF